MYARAEEAAVRYIITKQALTSLIKFSFSHLEINLK